MGVLITLLVIVAVWWLLRLLFPYILVALIRRQQRRWGDTMGGAGSKGDSKGGNGGRSGHKEGDVNIISSESSSVKVSKGVGDYVDFEETTGNR